MKEIDPEKLRNEALELRKAFRKLYTKTSNDFNELNKRLYELSKELDEFLGFIAEFTKET